MTKYAFIGSKETVKKKVKAFIENTDVDELMVATHVFDFEDRMKSVRLFAEMMVELNKEVISKKSSVLTKG